MLNIHRVIPAAVLLLALSVCTFAQTAAKVEVKSVEPPSALLLIDGKLAEIGTMEIARGQQVMVWIREFERLGWGTVQAGNSPEKTVLKAKNITLTFSKGQSIALVNSLAVQLPIDTYLRDGKLMVPLSFVAKSLGYSFELANRPVATVTTIPPPAPPKTNEIRGQVLYNGQGVSGIKVALVDPDYNTIKGYQAISDDNGEYAFDSVPNGKYLAYVWVGHNPDYFNRVSEEVEITDGKTAHLNPIDLGRIIRPIRPKVGEAAAGTGKIVFEWTPCSGATVYTLVVTKQVAEDESALATAAAGEQKSPAPLISLTTKQPKAEVVTKKLSPGVTYVADIEARGADGRFLGGTVGSGGKIWTFSIARSEKAAVTTKPTSSKPAAKPFVKVRQMP